MKIYYIIMEFALSKGRVQMSMATTVTSRMKKLEVSQVLPRFWQVEIGTFVMRFLILWSK